MSHSVKSLAPLSLKPHPLIKELLTLIFDVALQVLSGVCVQQDVIHVYVVQTLTCKHIQYRQIWTVLVCIRNIDLVYYIDQSYKSILALLITFY